MSIAICVTGYLFGCAALGIVLAFIFACAEFSNGKLPSGKNIFSGGREK
jgi:hypothetical protein